MIAHVLGEVRVNSPIERPAPALADARATRPARAAAARASTASPSLGSSLEDPDSSSIAGRRASGFLQVSLSKVSRHGHRGARPASSAETPPMNANDQSRLTRHCSPDGAAVVQSDALSMRDTI